MAANAEVLIHCVGQLTKTVGISPAEAPFALKVAESFLDGPGANQIQAIYTGALSLTTTPTALDLAGGVADAFGDTITFTEVKGIFVKAGDANTDNVLVGGATAAVAIFADASDEILVPPGGCFAWVAPGANGVPVAGGSSDVLELTAAAGTQACDVVVIGSTE